MARLFLKMGFKKGEATGRVKKMKILLGLSGGFDSTYSAKMLADAGHEVSCAVLIMHEHTDLAKPRASAELLGLPLFEIDCRELFDRVVKESFAREYSLGRTPNPCVICNPEVKFRVLADFAIENGFDAIATGHYAEIVDYVDLDGTPRKTFKIPRDRSKDQTYMLYRLTPDVIGMLYLPLGDSLKADLRQSVIGTELEPLDSRDSQEICFLPDGGYPEFVKSRLGTSRKGNFILSDGTIIGPHKGITYYTVGQRKGLGVSLGERAFVTDINPDTGDITLSTEPKFSSIIDLVDVRTPALNVECEREMRLLAKVRYAAPRVEASVILRPDGTATVILDSPAKSVTKGQSVVLYDGEIMVGGGIIDENS